MGQVRDLTPLRETDGRLVALPAVEDAITAGLDAIRNIQAQRRRTSASTPTAS